MENTKINLEIKKKLASNVSSDIVDAVSLINNKSQILLLPDLVLAYTNTSDLEAKNIIHDFFNNIKSNAAVNLISEMIVKEKNAETRLMLVSSAWQSGLDYSENLPVFISIMTDVDFLMAFEAFTVVESSLDFVTEESAKKALAADLKKKMKEMAKDMQSLTDDLIKMLVS